MKENTTTTIEHVEIKIKIGVLHYEATEYFHPQFEHTMYATRDKIRNKL